MYALQKIVTVLAIGLLAGCQSLEEFRQHRDFRFADAARRNEPDSPLLNSKSFSTQMEQATSAGHEKMASRVRNGLAELELLEVIQLGLENSKLVRVVDGDSVAASRSTFYDIASAEAGQMAALAAFDASLEASIYGRDIKRPPNAFFGPGLSQPLSRDEAALNFGIVKPTVTGARWGLAYDPDPSYFFVSNPASAGFNPVRNSNIQLSVTQPLLRGAGKKVNLIPVQISQIGIEQSTWQFKKTVMDSVRGTISAYWDLYSARAAIAAIDEVLPQLEEIVRLQTEALKAGWVVQADVAKAQTQLYDFRQSRLLLESKAVEQELRLRNLIGLAPEMSWKIVPATKPTNASLNQSSVEQLQQALISQPDIVQQRLNIRIRHLELSLAENQLKPSFDINALYRLNGIGENLGDALDQLATTDFRDLQFGATLSVPLGRRGPKAGVLSADRLLHKENDLLQQQVFSVYHDLVRTQQRMQFAFRQFEEAEKRFAASEIWVQGARLRYQNPNRDDGGENWLLENLNDYLNAIRFKTSADTDRARLLAEYNIEMARLEEIKGTLLEFFVVQFLGDTCLQALRLPPEHVEAAAMIATPDTSDDSSQQPEIKNQSESSPPQNSNNIRHDSAEPWRRSPSPGREPPKPNQYPLWESESR